MNTEDETNVKVEILTLVFILTGGFIGAMFGLARTDLASWAFAGALVGGVGGGLIAIWKGYFRRDTFR